MKVRYSFEKKTPKPKKKKKKKREKKRGQTNMGRPILTLA